jgi:GntR family transcriptional regulator of vanillate catabolism
MAEGEAERSVSNVVKAQLALRELILSGALPPGERLSELSVVERLGVSRTPVRMALVRLEEEGLLEAIPSGGFAVRGFSESDIDDAIEIRGALEGLAARFAAERGVSRARLNELKDCLADIDGLKGLSEGSEESFADYVRLNARFHALLHALTDSPALLRQIERACALPFASPSGFVQAQARLPQSRFILTLAQDQHRCLVEAIENREGERADALAREHARLARRNLRLAFNDPSALDLVAGAALIKRRGR